MPQKPVVYIPGFPASELFQQSTGRTVFPPSLADLLSSTKKQRLVALLTRPDPQRDIIAGPPIRRVTAIAKQAESLYDILRLRFGYTIDGGNNFRAVGWDWRFGIDDGVVQTAIAAAINQMSASAGSRVVVILHSTGGLVFRRALESQPQLAQHIDHILAFGVPWAGNLKALRYLTHGDAIGPFFAKLSAPQTRTVMRTAQAAYDLCPPDPVQTALVDASGTPLDLVTDSRGAQIGPMVTTTWIPAGDPDMHAKAALAHQRLGARTNQITLGGPATPPITNIAGWGIPTEVRAVVDASGGVTYNPLRRNRPVGDEQDGDGTVALKSATWLTGPTVRTFVVPIGVYPTAGIPNAHPRIWDSPPLEQTFREVLLPTAAEPWVWAAADGDQALDRNSPVTIRLVAQDVNGAPLPNARATLRLGTRPTTVAFGPSGRTEVVVRRGAMRANVANDLFRFTIDVEWGTSGRKELPVLIRV